MARRFFYPSKQSEIYLLSHPAKADKHLHIAVSAYPSLKQDVITVSLSSRVTTTREDYLRNKKYSCETLPLLLHNSITDEDLKKYLTGDYSYVNCNSLSFFDANEFTAKYISGPYLCPSDWFKSILRGITFSHFENRNRITDDEYKLICPSQTMDNFGLPSHLQDQEADDDTISL